MFFKFAFHHYYNQLFLVGFKHQDFENLHYIKQTFVIISVKRFAFLPITLVIFSYVG